MDDLTFKKNGWTYLEWESAEKGALKPFIKDIDNLPFLVAVPKNCLLTIEVVESAARNDPKFISRDGPFIMFRCQNGWACYEIIEESFASFSWYVELVKSEWEPLDE